jgi:Domain of unknown function (DUF1841)
VFTPTRDEARALFFATWRKFKAGVPLEGLETTVIGVLTAHPEYHAILEQPERNLHADYLPDDGQVNPFLHLSLHLAVEEQLSIDQPPGIRSRYQELAARLGSEHDAKHRIVECLAETVWQAQRRRSAFDERVYFDCLTRTPRG